MHLTDSLLIRNRLYLENYIEVIPSKKKNTKPTRSRETGLLTEIIAGTFKKDFAAWKSVISRMISTWELHPIWDDELFVD